MAGISTIRLVDRWWQPTVASSTLPEPAMPLVTLTVRKPKTPAFRRAVLDAVHASLVAIGVPADDRFQRVIALDAEDFVYDPRYPDAASPRDGDFALIEILFSAG